MYDCGCHAAHLHPAYICIVAGILYIHFKICCHIVIASEVLHPSHELVMDVNC